MAFAIVLEATGIDPQLGAVNERGSQLDALIDLVAQTSELSEK